MAYLRNNLCSKLVHEKILMAENLKKRKINDPSQCVLCGNAEETIKNLFCDFPFIVDTWNYDLVHLASTSQIVEYWSEMFIQWKHKSPCSPNSLLRRC